MSSRYGRNQKRQHREQIAKLEAQLENTVRGVHIAVRLIKEEHAEKLKTVRQDALNNYLNEYPRLDDIMKEIIDKIAQTVAPEVERLARNIMESGVKNDKFEHPLDIKARAVPGRHDEDDIYLSARIEPMDFKVHYGNLKAVSFSRMLDR